MPKPETPVRRVISPAEKALDALDVASRTCDRLEERMTKLADEHAKLSAELDAAITRRDYLALHPDLPANKAIMDAESAQIEPGQIELTS